MAEHWEREGRLGHEEIARDDLEGRIGRVGASLVVARYDDARALPLDQHLRAAEHMSGGEQRYGHVADADLLAIGGGLTAFGRRAKPRRHERERLARRQHMRVPRPGMVGMAVRDDRALGAAIGVDVEAAWPAIEPLAIDRQPCLEAFGFHFFLWLRGTKHGFASSPPIPDCSVSSCTRAG